MTAKCFDPNFRYTKSEDTCLRRTFARIRRQMKAAEAANIETQKKVAPIRKPKENAK